MGPKALPETESLDHDNGAESKSDGDHPITDIIEAQSQEPADVPLGSTGN